MPSRAVFLALSFALLVVEPSWADSIVVVPGPRGAQNAAYNGDVTIGWQFELTTPLDVTALGYFDAGGDGLFDPHPVGIFNSSGTLLASATVPGGAGGILETQFRFTPIVPIRLGIGSYTIGGFAFETSQDEFQFTRLGSRTIAGLVLGAGVQSEFGNTELTFPQRVNDFAAEGYFGPNFMATGAGAPIPEPGSLILASTGILGVLLRRRQTRRTAGSGTT